MKMEPGPKKDNTQKRGPKTFWQRNGVKLSVAAVVALGIGGAVYLVRNRNDEADGSTDKGVAQKSIGISLPTPPLPAKHIDSIYSRKDTAKQLAEKIKQEDTEREAAETTRTSKTADSEMALKLTNTNSYEDVPPENIKENDNLSGVSKNDSIKEDILLRDTVLYPQQAQKPGNVKTQDNSVEVEFWKSPVHYKGYKYFRNILTLYGVNKGDDIKLYFYDGELYMGKGGNYYKFNEEDAFNAFRIVKDRDILKHFGQ